MAPRSETSDDDAPIGRRGSYSKGVARRQEILDRAAEVFRERGPEGTSLRRVAEEIGVSHGALLHYFSSREQLLLALYEHTEMHRNQLGDGDEQASHGAVGKLVDAASVNVTLPGYVQLYSTLVANALEEERTETRDYFVRRFERVREQTAERLRRQQEAGEVRRGLDADKLAALLVAASDGLQTQWLLEETVDLEGSLELFEELLRP
ncbi:MAG: TetR/AcrR family transcriptional regulator [Brachybacterium sp.]|uniref:TetR/AcrR family transcriptional regulator n=1 Tax=Brachybacterium sp. TaxID=1891286 RepID=UPI002649C8A3|nr:TetR/AcrR family transcriptional regulator [Brachybacterium sp.]MDN5685373.1 TetR/AcrR family transcriptional regulator [Brachybacterium sp.]